MTPTEVLRLIEEGKSITFTDSTLNQIGEQYKYIVNEEQYGDKYVDGAPQWLTWYGLASTGELTQRWQAISTDNASMPLDAAAIAPTNLTHNRVAFLSTAAGDVGKRFRVSSTLLMNLHDVPTAKALQLAAIAALPAVIDNDDAYQRLWRRYKPLKSDRPMELEIVVLEDDKRTTHVVR